MSAHEIQDIFIELEKIKLQLGRLVSDAESEKELRKERNKNIELRIKALETDKIQRDTTIKNVKILWGVVWTLIGAFATFILTHLK